MRARDVAPGEDHYHEGRADCKRRNHPRAGANPRAADCQDEEECADEFCDVFVHMIMTCWSEAASCRAPVYQERFRKTSANAYWTLVLSIVRSEWRAAKIAQLLLRGQ